MNLYNWFTDIFNLNWGYFCLMHKDKLLDSPSGSFFLRVNEGIDTFFQTLLIFWTNVDTAMSNTPWWLTLAGLAAVYYASSRSWKLGLIILAQCFAVFILFHVVYLIFTIG